MNQILPTPRDRVNAICAAVAAEFQPLPAERLRQPCRAAFVVAARATAAQRLHREMGWGASAIGRYLRCHHTTILHYLSFDEAKLETMRRKPWPSPSSFYWIEDCRLVGKRVGRGEAE